MSQSGLNNKQIRILLRFIGVVFTSLGFFLFLQGDEPSFTLLDPETHEYLSYSLLLIGVTDTMISFVFFKDTEDKK